MEAEEALYLQAKEPPGVAFHAEAARPPAIAESADRRVQAQDFDSPVKRSRVFPSDGKREPCGIRVFHLSFACFCGSKSTQEEEHRGLSL